MMKFKVDKMSCNHCTNSISEAVALLDKAAKLTFDLGNRTVFVESEIELEEVIGAFTSAGFEATELNVPCCNLSNN